MPTADSQQAFPSIKLTGSAGQGRADAARGRDRRARQALLPGGRADHLGRGLRRAAAAQRGDRGALSRAGARGFAVAPRRRAAGAEVRQGAARGADALARQRVLRRGRRRVRRPHAPLPAAAGGRDGRLHRRAEDRRPVAARCATRAAGSCAARPAATAPKARTSPPMCARSRTSRSSCAAGRCRRSARCAARST